MRCELFAGSTLQRRDDFVQSLHRSFCSWTFCPGDYAEGFTSANGSPSQKSFKHLDRGSEQPFFRLSDTFCICAATGCDQSQELIHVDKLLGDQREGFLVAVSSLKGISHAVF